MESHQRPKVLIVITLFSIGGGTETVVAQAKGLLDKGYQVTIATGKHVPSEGNMLPVAQHFGLHVIFIPSLGRSINPIKDIIAFFSLFGLIRHNHYDIVHTNSSKAGIVGRFAARCAGVKIILHTIHGVPFHPFQNKIKFYFYVFLERMAALITTHLVSVSYKIVEDCLDNKVGSPNKYSVIRSSFETNLFSPSRSFPDINDKRKLWGLQANDFIIGKISRLHPQKGHEDLINALPKLLERYPNIKLLFLGDGELRDTFLSKVKKAQLEHKVIFVGSVAPHEVPLYISMMHTVVLLSLHEGLARVIPQALLMNKPVISYNLDGSPEVISQKKNGILIPPQKPDELQKAIAELIEHYPTYVKECALRREALAREFDITNMNSQIDHLYTKLSSSHIS